MFFKSRFFMPILIVLILTIINLSACSSSPSTILSPTETQSASPTIEPTETMEPVPSATDALFNETPGQSSDVTDEMLQAQRLAALEATKTLASSLPDASQEEITETLLRKWLAYYKTDQVDAYMRLKDYIIEEVTFTGAYCPPPDKDTTKFLSRIDISVQTVTLHSGDWEATPNGIDGDDQWIFHMSSYVGVSMKDGIYTLSFDGQMGCG